MSDAPELGQIAFHAGTIGTHPCPDWVDALVRDLLDEIDRVFWNQHQREWDRHEDPKIPGVEFRPYYWGDDEVEAARPNLAHAGIEVRWYKHPMRGSSLNVDAEPAAMLAWFASARAAIHAHERNQREDRRERALARRPSTIHLPTRIATARAMLEALASEFGRDAEQHPYLPALARVIDALDGES